MEVLRVPPYSLSVTIAVSSANTEYAYTLTDMSDNSVTTASVTSDSSSNVSIALPSNYDTQYLLYIDN